MRKIVITIFTILLTASIALLFPHESLAQVVDGPCSFKVWVNNYDSNGKLIGQTYAPDHFVDKDLVNIHYEITIDLTILPSDRNFLVFTDSNSPTVDYHEEKTADPNTGIFTGTIVRSTSDVLQTNARAFQIGTHPLTVKFFDDYYKDGVDLCSTPYTIDKGPSQEPITCSVRVENTEPSVVNPNLIYSTDPLRVIANLPPYSYARYKYLNIVLAPVYIDVDAVSLSDNTITRVLDGTKSGFTGNPSDPSELISSIIKGGSLRRPGDYKIVLTFSVTKIKSEKVGECTSPPFRVCKKGDTDPACLFPPTPTITLTPSPTPTDAPICDTEMCKNVASCHIPVCRDSCKICRPTATPIPPFPTLKPLCDAIGQGWDQSDCRKCVDPPSAGIWTAIGCVPTSMQGVLKDYFLPYGIGIAGGIAFLYFIYGAFLILTSAGNAERVEEARSIMTSAISGLILIIFSILLLRIIGVNILKIPDFK